MTKTLRVLSAGLGLVLLGAANHMSPETVMKALRLVKEGKIYELGRVLEPAMPLFGLRKFNLYTLRTGPSSGPNELRGNEETVTTERV